MNLISRNILPFWSKHICSVKAACSHRSCCQRPILRWMRGSWWHETEAQKKPGRPRWPACRCCSRPRRRPGVESRAGARCSGRSAHTQEDTQTGSQHHRGRGQEPGRFSDGRWGEGRHKEVTSGKKEGSKRQQGSLDWMGRRKEGVGMKQIKGRGKQLWKINDFKRTRYYGRVLLSTIK